jgi:hypothetical protein
MSVWVNRVADDWGRPSVYFRSTSKADVNSAGLTIEALFCVDRISGDEGIKKGPRTTALWP